MIDLLITGSSRPQLLKYTFNSFDRFVGKLTNKKIRKLFHEDFVFPEESKKSIEIAKNKKIDLIKSSDPKIGLGRALDYMINNVIPKDKKYLFYLQDDWEFERPIELDRILWTMENNPEINLVLFSHYRNVRPDFEFKSEEYNFDGLKLCSYNAWSFVPGIWRMSKVREKWACREIRPEGHFTNQFGTHEQRLDKEYSYKNIGAFYYGGMGEYRYVRHLGSTWRMADWRLKNGKPSGKRHWEIMSLFRDRSPWLHNLEERPLNKDIQLEDEWKEKIKRTYPKHIQEIYCK
jgi:hypothetical protein